MVEGRTINKHLDKGVNDLRVVKFVGIIPLATSQYATYVLSIFLHLFKYVIFVN